MNGVIQLYNSWGFLMVDHEVGRYYRNLFLRTFGLKLQRPSNTEHISIVSPYDKVDLSKYHHFNGVTLNFTVGTIPWHNNDAVWIQVFSEEINEFRKILGLKEPEIPLHLCIGYM